MDKQSYTSLATNSLKKSLFEVSDGYYVLLTLFNCSFLLSLGAGYWEHQNTTAFIIIMIVLQFLSKKFWFTTFLSFIPFYVIKAPLFPRLTNHGNLQVFIGIIIIIYVISAIKRHSHSFANTTVLQNIFIYTLATLYIVAGIHKLNLGFFNLDSSCTHHVSFVLNTFLYGDEYSSSLIITRISQVLTLFFELIVPLGFLFHNTRKPSIWLMVFFHAGMSLFGFSNFSALAGFLLCGCIIDFKGNQVYYKSVKKGLKAYIIFSIASVVLSYSITRLEILNVQYVRIYNGLIFNIGWLIFFTILITNTKIAKQYRTISRYDIILVMLIIIWGGQAYLGLSNAGNLTMFSNLETEKSRSNHLLFDTNKTKIWSFEEDLVTILKLPEHLKWQGSIPLDYMCKLPLIEFKTQANQWVKSNEHPLELTISYKDQVIYIKNLKESEFSDVKWWYRYIYFRKIPKEGNSECLW